MNTKHTILLKHWFRDSPEVHGAIETGVASAENNGAGWSVLGADGYVIVKVYSEEDARAIATAIRQDGMRIVW